MCKSLRFSLIAFAFVILATMSASAQSTVTGAIGGVVMNPAKEVIPGATVSVRNTETNKESTATTDDQGRFVVTNLQPGTYAITINSTGFSAFTQDAVVVEVGRTTSLEV